jgi:hypothetical protein
MNKLQIKKSAWHYRLALKFGWTELVRNPNWGYRDTPMYVPNDDFCSYLRRVLLGLAIIALCAGMLAFYCYCNYLLCVDLLKGTFVFQNGPLRQLFAVTFDVIIVVLAAGWVLWNTWIHWGLGDWVYEKTEGWRDALYEKSYAKRKTTPARDPFYKAAYETLKHKFCMKIEVTND